MILVTGGTGLLGSHLLFDLIQKGKKVRALKRPNSNIDLVKNIFHYYSPNADQLFNQIEWVNGDVLDVFSLQDALKDVTDVYHCAAMVSFNPNDQSDMMRINIEGTANLVNSALDLNIRKFCHVSSIAALGRADKDGITDETTYWKDSENVSNYSISKHEGEKEVWRAIEEGLNAVIVNPSVIIGPGDWTKGPSQFFPLIWKGLKFYTKGVNGYIDVRDVSQTMIKLMESDTSAQRFILSSENLSYKVLFELISNKLDKNPPSHLAGPYLSELVWRIEALRSFFSNHPPLITRETARTANKAYIYSSKKIIDLLGIEFRSMKQSINDTGSLFLIDQKNTI